jgi:hypothetical protein
MDQRPEGGREGAEDRQDAIKDRQEDRRDWADDAREDRQENIEKIRKERKEHYEKYYDEYWGWHHAYWGSRYYSRTAFLALDCGRTTVVVSTHSYYYCGGTYYDRVYIQNEVQYVPVSAPDGAELDQLDDATAPSCSATGRTCTWWSTRRWVPRCRASPRRRGSSRSGTTPTTSSTRSST